ncbi:MAG: hypothetical protein A3C06_04230 [Candidatus Taylorbacteria bacterium RIFCSPHIGHO2_02_FULL_46_13]|uniref:Uncharacterized protein n=1 Tax=Candidatus Taylorbacteria bacterium RIFCSPHIGHO2_02_FULL_46_13 TaxID=1802312 RepID=A0A1G2MWA8_9BACT|nr:MAG: hypothetical protein A3C06_04230 [Candidatus Taylorbacteria bacterium RIFCSPHIGHO2_02_FULL_46_13]
MNRCAIAYLFIAGIGVYILLAMITMPFSGRIVFKDASKKVTPPLYISRGMTNMRKRVITMSFRKNPKADVESARCIGSFPDLASAFGFFVLRTVRVQGLLTGYLITYKDTFPRFLI